MRTPMMEKIVQTAKQIAKATVERDSARPAPAAGSSMGIMLLSMSGNARKSCQKKCRQSQGDLCPMGETLVIGGVATLCARHWTQHVMSCLGRNSFEIRKALSVPSSI